MVRVRLTVASFGCSNVRVYSNGPICWRPGAFRKDFGIAMTHNSQQFQKWGTKPVPIVFSREKAVDTKLDQNRVAM
ncbi:hypothetical protein Ddc_15621 [Ditylenchus destructor]|nr:hypothetical protein Ddc_15621 [Ditylenchus destructor]